MGYQSNNNAVLYNNCQPLQNLTILLEVTEDLVTEEGAGFSLQLNTYPVTGQTCQGNPMNWLQYIIYVLNDQVYYEVQYWSIGSSTWPPGYSPIPGTSPWLPCWANDDQLIQFGPAPNNQILRESTMQIALATDNNSRVVSVNFNVTDQNGNVSQKTFTLPEIAKFQICACEVNLVGPGNFTNCTFTPGIAGAHGLLYYSVKPGTLSVQNGGAGSACGEIGGGTGETSNMVYTAVSPSSGTTVTQSLGQQIDCSLNGMAMKENTPQANTVVAKLREVRDQQMRAVPSGQWLIELFERNVAEIANLFNEDPELHRTGWELVQKAEAAISNKQPFSAELIDAAEALVERGARKATRDLAAEVTPFLTVLKALKGNTFEEGLKKASQTILPRFPQTHLPKRAK